jgi:hypothetical protein
MLMIEPGTKNGETAARIVQGAAGFFDVGQTADTRAHGHANALAVGVGDFQAGITHRLKTGRQAVLNEQVKLAGLFDRQVFLNLEAFTEPPKRVE